MPIASRYSLVLHLLVAILVANGAIAQEKISPSQDKRDQTEQTPSGQSPPKPGDSEKPIDPDGSVIRQCVQLIGQRQFEQARTLAQRLVRDYPRSSRAYLMLALTYHKERKYEQAEPLLKKAVDLDATHHPPKMFLGWCRYYLGKQDEAEEAFKAYLPTNPDYPDIHFALGLIAYERDQLEEALKRFDKAVELAHDQRRNADEAKSRARRADVLIRQNKLEQARDELITAVRLNPQLYGAMFKLSRVFYRLGDVESARKAKQMHDTVREKRRPTRGHPE